MIQLIRGFKDILPGEVELWQHIETLARKLFEDFGYKEIRVPMLEKSELFARSIGEDTDIVEKEMYTFPDRGGDLITLRPEATAAIVRSYIQHKLYAQDPVQKLFTIGPMFRRERPQKGRYRQFYQIDAEVFGVTSPYIDAQLIFMLVTLMRRLNVFDATAHINSLGCPACRPDFKKALIAFLAGVRGDLCSDCVRRCERNPLRVLDCKVPGCREATQKAPSILDNLCQECHSHFKQVKLSLDQLGITHVVDKSLVRGLDYYSRTTFEIQTSVLGAQNAIAGGGRYDGLIKSLGGPDQPAIGFAIGFDRLVEVVGLNQGELNQKPHLFIAALGAQCQEMAFSWQCALGLGGIRAEIDFSNRSLKSQMRQANRLEAGYVLILGENEIERQKAVLRNMATKNQTDIPFDGIINSIRTIVG